MQRFHVIVEWTLFLLPWSTSLHFPVLGNWLVFILKTSRSHHDGSLCWYLFARVHWQLASTTVARLEVGLTTNVYIQCSVVNQLLLHSIHHFFTKTKSSAEIQCIQKSMYQSSFESFGFRSFRVNLNKTLKIVFNKK